MRVLVTAQFDWKIPGVRAWKSFPPGEHVMTKQQADDAEAAGKGRKLSKKKAEPDAE